MPPGEGLGEASIAVNGDADIVAARSRAKEMASAVGFSRTNQTVIATAVSEIARNIVVYAGSGEIVLRAQRCDGRWGLVAVASDEGPGIADVEQALTEGYSTAGSLGVGLSGARRLMDSMEIDSEVGRGTTVTMCKWADRRG
ncbi:MAG: anti-sigma regulatory factor [Actinobacteria bacterium]|nr:anti-sigma regulatory factor [Actinomycetota bacterium]MBW3648979.1 anti-sigma regulatory factor [Actinomycetota bacterium]